MSSRTAARIAVLMGGRSAEREVSLVLGSRVRGCVAAGGISRSSRSTPGADLASALLAAQPGRRLQRAARPLGRGRLRPGHPGVAADPLHPFRACWPRRWPWTRRRAKQVFAAAGLPVARGMIVCREHIRAAHPMEPPYVVKPNAEGSSVGVYIVPRGRQPAAGAGRRHARAGAGRGVRRGARADHGGDGRPGR